MTDIICDICGEKFKAHNGLANHKKWKHGVRSKKKPVPETNNSEPSLSEIILMMEVKRDSLNEFIEHLRSLKK